MATSTSGNGNDNGASSSSTTGGGGSSTVTTPVNIRGVLRRGLSTEYHTPTSTSGNGNPSGASGASASAASPSPAAMAMPVPMITSPPRPLPHGHMAASLAARAMDDMAQLKRLRIIASYSPQAVSLPVLLVINQLFLMINLCCLPLSLTITMMMMII